MKEIIRMVVNITHIISFCGVLLFGILGIIHEIIGPIKFQRMLSTIGISKSVEELLNFSYIMIFVLIITYVIKIKVFIR